VTRISRYARCALAGLSLVVLAAGPAAAEIATAAAKVHHTAGLAEFNARKFDAARAAFKKALAATSVKAEQHEITIWITRCQAAAGKVAEARAALKAALKSPSGALAAELGRSYCQHQPVDYKEAIKFLREVCNTYGAKEAEPWLVLARAFVLDTQYDSAIKTYELLLKKVNKKELAAYVGLAEAMVLNRQFQAASDVLHDRALPLFPDHPEILFAIGRVKERDTRLGTRGPRIAAEYYQTAHKLSGGNPRFAAAAMFTLLVSGDTTGALDVFRTQSAKTPQDSFVVWFEGLNVELEWRIPQALALYQRAVELNVENVYAHYVLARVYLGLGNKALRLSGPEPPEAFRVAPFVDHPKGAQEVATIKFLDPSFPLLGPLSTIYEEILNRQTAEQNMTPEQKASVEKLVDYQIKMNRFR
jgi:tetratricopeptide (TPR) repeat protein